MTSRIASDLLLLGIFVVLLTGALLAWKGPKGYYLNPSPNKFVVLQSRVQSAAFAMSALFFLLFPLVLAGDDLRFYGVVLPDHWPLLWILIGVCLLFAVFCLWMGRPQEIVLDKDQNTYQHMDGWPPFRRVRTGPWSDLEGIETEYSGKRNTGYVIYVRWRCGSVYSRIMIDNFRSVERAEDCARDLAKKLDLLIIPMPRPRWS